jgi:hypothetical protein
MEQVFCKVCGGAVPLPIPAKENGKYTYSQKKLYSNRKVCDSKICRGKVRSWASRNYVRKSYEAQTTWRGVELIAMDVNRLHAGAVFNLVLQLHVDLFNFLPPFNYSIEDKIKWVINKREKDLKFLSSKLCQAFCDCSDNFEQSRLIKDYEFASASAENSLRQATKDRAVA